MGRRRNPGDDELRALDRAARASGAPEDLERSLLASARHGIDPIAWAAGDPGVRFPYLWHADVRRQTREEVFDPDAPPLPFLEEVDEGVWTFQRANDVTAAIELWVQRYEVDLVIRRRSKPSKALPGVVQVGSTGRHGIARSWDAAKPLIKNPLTPLLVERWYDTGGWWKIDPRSLPLLNRDLLFFLEAHDALGWPLGKGIPI